MSLASELSIFLSERGIKCSPYSIIRGSKVVSFFILNETHDRKFRDECLNKTLSNKLHRLTFSEYSSGAYACNFQPLNLKNYPTRHCSECTYFWSNPQVGQMYCEKLEKRITARKKPCKYFEKNT